MKKLYNLGIIATLSLILCVVLVSDAAAANIFETVKEKVYTTLKDLRTVIYLVGGIGLICFTFAAIFGRISFKHLATICFSLFLVAAMGLFISYFTGDGTAESELEYKDNTPTHNSTVPNDSPTGGKCGGGECPESPGKTPGKG